MQALNCRLRWKDARPRGLSVGYRAPVRIVCSATKWRQGAFSNFKKQKFPDLLQENSNYKLADLNSLASKAWGSLSEEQQRRYITPPQVEQGAYYPSAGAPPPYYQPPMPGPAPGYPGAPGGFSMSHGTHPEWYGTQGPAGRKLTAWQSFSKSNFPAIRKEMMKQDPGVPNTAVMTELGKKWASMTEAEKAMYAAQAERQFKVQVDRPKSGWQVFQHEYYGVVEKQLKAKDPGALITTKEVQAELGRRWKDLPKPVQQQYTDKAEQTFDEEHGFPPNGGPAGPGTIYGQGPYGYPQPLPPQQYPPQQYPPQQYPKGRSR